ncbi:MAG: 3-dehydroquinate synthase [Flavobacteriaceae bacterium]
MNVLPPIPSLNYKVVFGESGRKAFQQLIQENDYSAIFVLVDSNTHQHCLSVFMPSLATDLSIDIIEIEAGEAHKHLQSCLGVWETLSENGADRKSLLINLGGGVVTDLGGFVAATFKRGIDFINVPTSLLAMVDASVGGKTGVDLGVLKNQVGIIVQPQLVWVNDLYLQTLPPEQLRSGYAEMLKHGLIADPPYWNKLAAFGNLRTDTLLPTIHHSVSIKNEVVKKDPTEKGWRKILNFGHTLGHAIESYALENQQQRTLLHGEAIAVGMIMEAYLSVSLCGLPLDDAKTIRKIFLSIFSKENFPPEAQKAIVKLLVFDKKNSHGQINFLLLEAIGKPVIDVKVPHALFAGAFAFYNDEIL